MESTKTPIAKKDLLLILFGALVTGVPILLANFLNQQFQANQAVYTARKDFVRELTEMTGERLYVTFSLFRVTRDGSPDGIKQYKNEYLTSVANWNRRSHFYLALIQHYYGQDKVQEFFSKIYGPLIDLGIRVDSRSYTAQDRQEITEQYTRIDDNLSAFIFELMESR